MGASLASSASADPSETHPAADAGAVKVAIIGRPNVGKSTLVNSLVGEERVIAFDQPGTTRDSIYLDFERNGRQYVLIDTAGVRRRGKVLEAVEKFSVIKTMQAIEDANVVVLLFDAEQGISEQDAHLAGYILEAGRALVVAVNKWDRVPPERRDDVKRELDRKAAFLAFARHHYISAREGSGLPSLLRFGRRRLRRRNGEAFHAEAHQDARRGRDAPAAAPRGHGAAQDALCPPRGQNPP